MMIGLCLVQTKWQKYGIQSWDYSSRSYYWANNNNSFGPYRWIRHADGGGGSDKWFNAEDESYIF